MCFNFVMDESFAPELLNSRSSYKYNCTVHTGLNKFILSNNHISDHKQNPAADVSQSKKRSRRKRSAARKSNKVIYQPPPKVVDYLNERDLKEHYDDLAMKMKKRFQWGSKEFKVRFNLLGNQSF